MADGYTGYVGFLDEASSARYVRKHVRGLRPVLDRLEVLPNPYTSRNLHIAYSLIQSTKSPPF